MYEKQKPIKTVVVQTPSVPIMRWLLRAISSVTPSIKLAKDEVEGTNVRCVTRIFYQFYISLFQV
jgi:hypothetical protein